MAQKEQPLELSTTQAAHAEGWLQLAAAHMGDNPDGVCACSLGREDHILIRRGPQPFEVELFCGEAQEREVGILGMIERHLFYKGIGVHKYRRDGGRWFLIMAFVIPS